MFSGVNRGFCVGIRCNVKRLCKCGFFGSFIVVIRKSLMLYKLLFNVLLLYFFCKYSLKFISSFH